MCFLVFSFLFPSLSHELTYFLFLILKRKGYPLALIIFSGSPYEVWARFHMLVLPALKFLSEAVLERNSMSRKVTVMCLDIFLVETIQKLSVCLLTARHVLSKKAQQSFLCISLPIFTFPTQLEELGRMFKSLDPHFVLLHITAFSFSFSPVLFFFVSALFAEGTKSII